MQGMIRGRGQERGAVAVIVALVVGMFVLTGVAALAVDAGSIYTERRVVQNGADAAALALAQICAVNYLDPKCANTADLTTLAGDNAADDHLTSIFSICGSGPEMALKFPACAGGTALIDCPVLPSSFPANVNYVEVRTRTLSTSSSSVVRRVFAGFGDKTYNGKTVQACARAAYGPLTNATSTVPFTISSCEWGRITGSTIDPVTGAITSEPAAYPTTETALAFNYQTQPVNKIPACASFNGHAFPGGFGWTDRSYPDCAVSVQAGGWLGSQDPNSNGIGGGVKCLDVLTTYIGKDVYLPIFDCVNDNKIFCPSGTPSQATWYHVWKLAAFHMDAVDIGGINIGTATPTAKAYCLKIGTGTACIYGYFKKELGSDEGDIGDPTTVNLKINTVKLAG